MKRSSRFLLPMALFVLAASLAAGVPSAKAIDPFPTTGVVTLSSQYFMIHWSRDKAPCPLATITQEQAGEILGMADRAYKFYSGEASTLGVSFATPTGDSDGLIDIYVDDFGTECIPGGGTIDPTVPRPLNRWNAVLTPGSPAGGDQIHLNSASGLEYPMIAHEVFHVFADQVAPGADQWLQEGLAEWGATRANNAASGLELNPDRTMDCVGSGCGDSEFDRNGYPGWMLFEYLAERFGDATTKTVLETAATPGLTGTQAMSAVVTSLGPTLGKFFEDYTTARLTGNFKFPALAGVLPKTQATVIAPTSTGALNSTILAVNHLAVRYIDIAHAADSDTGPCYAAKLDLKVTLPPSVPSTPYFYANTKGSTATPFSVSGNTATMTVPDWNTCAGSPHAYVSLPNESSDAAPPVYDGREFSLTGTVTVDKSKPAAASEPPTPVKVTGPIVNVPTSDPAPDLTVYAPELIRVSAKTRLLRFVVFSGGTGTLKATIGSSWLGSSNLHAGNNDIRFVLPSQLLKTLKKTNTPNNVMTLTSFSPSGAKGETITRRVAVQAAKKAKKR
jgi:hypothetical protein